MIDLVDHAKLITLGTNFYGDGALNYGRDGAYSSLHLPYNSYYSDPVLADVRKIEFRYPAFPILENLGYAGDSPSIGRTSVIYGFPPSPEDLPPKLPRLKEIDSVFRFLSGDSNDKLVSNEHTIAHVNVTGKVEVGSVPSDVPGGADSSFRTFVTVVDGSFELSGAFYPHLRPSLSAHDGIADIVSKLETGAYNIFVDPGIFVWVKDLSMHLVDGCLRGIVYTLVNAGWYVVDGVSSYLAYKEVRIGLGFIWNVVSSTPETSAYLYERLEPSSVKRVRCIRHYSRVEGAPIVWHTDMSFGADPSGWVSDTQTWAGYWTWSCSSTPKYGWEQYSGISGETGYRKVDSAPTSLLRFRRNIRGMSDDLLAMGCLAQGDAYDTGFKVLKSNLLETLLEAGDIFSLVKSPFEMIQIARNVGKSLGHENWHSIKLLLDFYSDAQLYYSFMLNPVIELATEMSEKSSRLARSFDQYFGYRTIQGKAVYEIGSEIPLFTGNFVVARSKMRVRIPPDVLWSIVLPLEQLHLLPDLSTYWETLRLSFVVDWFFNVQSKLKVVDQTIKFMALDVGNCVNSVTLYKPVVPTDFTVADGTAYKYYCRYVLTSPQVFTPTRLNVLGAQGPPSWLTAGSLLYKLS